MKKTKCAGEGIASQTEPKSRSVSSSRGTSYDIDWRSGGSLKAKTTPAGAPAKRGRPRKVVQEALDQAAMMTKRKTRRTPCLGM